MTGLFINPLVTAMQINLSVDQSQFSEALEELKSYVQSPQTSPKIIDRILSGLNSFGEFVSIDVDRSSATGAGDLRVLFKPSDSFRELLSTLRASKLQAM